MRLKRSPIRKVSAKREAEGKKLYSTIRRRKRKDKVFKDGRVFLSNKSKLRRDVFERDKGLCQRHLRNGFSLFIAFSRGVLAHRRHGPFRNDTPEGTEWSCAECHEKEHGHY